jgi:hypothetical protein
MKENYLSFLRYWDMAMLVLTVVAIATGVIVLIYHWVRLASLKDYKKKYDYLNSHDTRMIFYGIAGIGVGLILFFNSVQTVTVQQHYIWFIVRMFIAVCFGTLVIYTSYLMLKFAYPTVLERKLKKWRFKPRVNHKTGNKMKLLSEEEEDVHLDEGMQAEENVFSVDYDVWVDEETGDVQIEKYPGHLHALQCNSCGFQTMKLVKEEIRVYPTNSTEGELIKHYKCSYCKSKRTKPVKIAKLSQNEKSYTLPVHPHFVEEEKVDLVTIEIHTSTGKSKMFEFTNTHQAGEFLKEYKVSEME